MLIKIILAVGMLLIVTIILVIYAKDRNKNEPREIKEIVRKHLDRTS